MSIPVIFMDRDGTLNIDHNFIHKIEEFDFIDGVIDACKALKKMGFALVIVTNQSGIGRGIFSEEQFLQLTEWMDWSLADRDVELDGIYYCPHLPTDQCECRKPNPGMFLAAKKELDIDMASSYMVGDKASDLLAGKAAGVGTCVLVRSGHRITSREESLADIIIDDLTQLPAIISKKIR